MNPDPAGRKQLIGITVTLIGGVLLFAGFVTVLHVRSTLDPPYPGPALRLGALLLGMGLLGAAHWATARPGPGSPHRGREDGDRFFTRLVVAQAIREAAGLLGSVAGYLTGDLLATWALAAAAVAAMLAGIPGREEWRLRTRR